MRKWQNSRIEQEEIHGINIENQLRSEVLNCEEISKIENIISKNISSFLQKEISDMENDIKMWTHLFDKEFEDRQQNIQDLQVRNFLNEILYERDIC